MTTPVHCIDVGADMGEAERRLQTCAVSSLAVVRGSGEEQRLLGVLSRTDLLRSGRRPPLPGVDQAGLDERAALLRLGHHGIHEVMSKPPIVVHPESTLREAAQTMVGRHVHRVFVVAPESERPVGVLSTRDLLRAVHEARLPQPIRGFMSAPVLTLSTETPVGEAVDVLTGAHVQGLVVVEGEWPVGFFTQVEALAAKELSARTALEEVMSYSMLCLDPDVPLYRAAAQMAQTQARRIIVVSARDVLGIVTPTDLARAIAS